ncbi:hypothetical protein BDZ91DRAFT_735753 [Kalaharituber pfeilii]|nr:hypothetical protein BDZ91DRAFT_735753 [Kalaharituber pfeilii]
MTPASNSLSPKKLFHGTGYYYPFKATTITDIRIMPSKKSKRRAAAFKANDKASNKAGLGGNTSTVPTGKLPQNALIMAIDFGTTFSALAWHNTESGKTHHIRDWPNQSQSSDKVPTTLSYTSKGTCDWGHLKSTTNRLEWFKLLLNEGNYTTSAELLNRLETKGLTGYSEGNKADLANLRTTIRAIPEGKKPADLAADYLRELYKYGKERLSEAYPALRDDLGSDEGVQIKCCLTVPAIWDDKGKEMTKQAAIDAGISEKHIYMISEPEAAAVHCLTDLDEMKGSLKVGDVYVIVDCGGGTVDLISYQVTSTKPLRVDECAVGTGGLYGSTLLNREFETLVKHRIGKDAFDQMDDEDLQVMRKDFETEIKPKFNPDRDDDDDDDADDDDDDDADDVVMCALPGVPDSPEKGVRKRKITFTTKEIKGIFEPTFTKIAEAVQKQVIAAQEASRKNVNGIILVGGFGSSTYLANWLKANVRNKDGTEIKLIRPLAPALAIVIGAVNHGVQMHLSGETSWRGIVNSRKARYSYGISVAEAFRFGFHPANKLVMDPFFGIPMCRDRMEWFIRKGENMRQGVGISVDFHRRCPIIEEVQREHLIFDEEIYVSAEDTAPMDKEHPSVRKLLTYKTDLNEAPRRCFNKRRAVIGLDFWDIPASIRVKLESAELTFTSLVGGKACGNDKKLWDHEAPSTRGTDPEDDVEVFFYPRNAPNAHPGWGYIQELG